LLDVSLSKVASHKYAFAPECRTIPRFIFAESDMMRHPQSGVAKHRGLLVLALAALSCNVVASPSHYRQFWSNAVVEHWARGQSHRARSAGKKQPLPKRNNDAVDCGTKVEGDPMWFTQGGCSIASRNMTYADTSGPTPVMRTVVKGDLIKMTCDDVFCPIPARIDCYEQPGTCANDEWCMIDIHEKWGAWAMNRDGSTPASPYCFAAAEIAANSTDEAFLASYQEICVDSTVGDYGIKVGPKVEAWKPARGTCVKYRTEQQSCLSNPLDFGAYEADFGLGYKRADDGRTFARPLVCGSGLTCTTPDFEVSPSTCVKQRPKHKCFAGPWWDSTQCPRTDSSAPKGGLSQQLAIEALRRAILLYPGEVASPGDCAFWNRNTALGASVLKTQRSFYNIAAALWPTHLFGALPSFNEVMKLVSDPNLLGDSQYCLNQAVIAGSEIAKALAEAGTLSSQPNQVWSMVHFLMHNQQNPMTPKQIAASRSLAGHLSESFWCDDCRGFFTIGIVGRYGLPPQSSDPEDHARYWWFGHNVASEHVATTRGGHPWIHQLGAKDVTKYQNPYFMTWADAVQQWTYQK
jgi:hypothetical protein